MPKPKIENHDNDMELDPIINALLEHLPPPGDYWSVAERKQWLEIMEMSFNLIYDDQPQDSAEQPHHRAESG